MKLLIIAATLFVVGSLAGYIIEVLFRRFVSQKRWMNPGFMHGPYIPLYGFGVALLYLISNIDLADLGIKIYIWQIIVKILVIGITMTLIELIAGLIFIKTLHLKLWDYSDRWGNFKGIICPLFSFIWFIVGGAYFFFLNPFLVDIIAWLSDNIIYCFFVGIVIGMMIVDFAYSLHLGIKVKKIADTINEKIRFEDFKISVKDNFKKHFNDHRKSFGSLLSNYENFDMYIAKYKERISRRKNKSSKKDAA